MISGVFLDSIIIIYVGYAIVVGFSQGLFNVLVGVFGVYGSLFLAWAFQVPIMNWAVEQLGVSSDINRALGFVIIWGAFYVLTRLLATVLTTAFKLTGINFILRISGAGLNALKAVVVVTVVVTFLTHINKQAFEPTELTDRLAIVGSKIMRLVNNRLDEGQTQHQIEADIPIESAIIDDDFKYNLLTR
ncbi:MAG: CvpA family protein [Candidatus Margulisbacteria bacterium]|nr:CvpA family protein [Candidatus Margulisiibacteriota bacterium]